MFSPFALVSCIFLADESVTPKASNLSSPDAAIFEYALELTQSRAEQCVMIGDTLEVDILGAKNMGMDTIYFNPAKPHDNKVVPTYVIENLAVLKTLIKKLK